MATLVRRHYFETIKEETTYTIFHIHQNMTLLTKANVNFSAS